MRASLDMMMGRIDPRCENCRRRHGMLNLLLKDITEEEVSSFLDQNAILPENMRCHSDDRWLAYVRERMYERVVKRDLDTEMTNTGAFSTGMIPDEDISQLIISTVLERKASAVGYQLGVINPMYRGKILRPVGIEVFRAALQEFLYGNMDFDAPLVEGYRKLSLGAKMVLNSLALQHYIGVNEGGENRFHFIPNVDISCTKVGTSGWTAELERKWGTRLYLANGSYPELETKIYDQLQKWKIEVRPITMVIPREETVVKLFVEVDTGLVPLTRAATLVDEKFQIEMPMMDFVAVGQYRGEQIVPYVCKQEKHEVQLNPVKAVLPGRKAVEVVTHGCRGVLCGEEKPSILVVHTRGKICDTLTPVVFAPGSLPEEKIDKVLSTFETWESGKSSLLEKLLVATKTPKGGTTNSSSTLVKMKWQFVQFPVEGKSYTLNEYLQYRKEPLPVIEFETNPTMGAEVFHARYKFRNRDFPWSVWMKHREMAQRQAQWMAIRELEKEEQSKGVSPMPVFRMLKAHLGDFTLHGKLWAAIIKVAGNYQEPLAVVPYREYSDGETALFVRETWELDVVLRAVQVAGFFILTIQK